MDARAVVEPLITPALLRGDPAALAGARPRGAPAPAPRPRRAGQAVDGGRPHRLLGRAAADRRALPPARRRARAAVDTGEDATSSLSDLDERREPVRAGRRQDARGLHAHEGAARRPAPVRDLPAVRVHRREQPRPLALAVLPALLAGLLLLELANFAIARWFAQRMRRADQQRVTLLAKARDASSRERRRIAADLHDGVVQDLTAASLTVGGAARALDERAVGPATISALDEAAGTMRESVGTLRTLLMDFYPADLEARGLAASLCDLAALARTRGAVAEVDVPEAFRAPLDTEALLYRVAQEAMRNAVTHSHASRVSIRAGPGGWAPLARGAGRRRRVRPGDAGPQRAHRPAQPPRPGVGRRRAVHRRAAAPARGAWCARSCRRDPEPDHLAFV